MPQAGPKSSSGQEQPQTAPSVSNPSTFPQHLEDDTIDLYELFNIIWNGKWLVIVVTLVAALGAIFYALQLQRIYKAEALLLPPKEKDVQSLNVLGMIENNIKQKSTGSKVSDIVFSEFKKNLYSRTIHKKFIKEYGLMELLAPTRTFETRDVDIYKAFAEMIKLGENNELAFLSIEMHNAEIAAKWVNDLTKFVDKETVIMLVEDAENSIANQIRRIEYTIASKRQMAKKRREDLIVQYQEAASIAQKLGVIDRVDSTNIVQNNQLNITTSNIPLYFRGYRALNTEIFFLNSRETDDPFIAGLRDLQEQLALLRSIKFDKNKMNALHVDQPAYPPKYAIKPNRRLIVSLATGVGLISGIFLVFFIEFVKNQRKKRSV